MIFLTTDVTQRKNNCPQITFRFSQIRTKIVQRLYEKSGRVRPVNNWQVVAGWCGASNVVVTAAIVTVVEQAPPEPEGCVSNCRGGEYFVPDGTLAEG